MLTGKADVHQDSPILHPATSKQPLESVVPSCREYLSAERGRPFCQVDQSRHHVLRRL